METVVLVLSFLMNQLATPQPAPVAPAAPGSWLHPIAASERNTQAFDGSHFGAPRNGHRAPECGRGHCGIDLYGTRGTPVVAVAAGKVGKVVRSRHASGGRYIQIQHADGLASFYFHLDAIRDDLVAGSPVLAGECIGTLGISGIRRSAPHLHFGVTKARTGKAPRYVNPQRYLAGAKAIGPHDVNPQLASALPTF